MRPGRARLVHRDWPWECHAGEILVGPRSTTSISVAEQPEAERSAAGHFVRADQRVVLAPAFASNQVWGAGRAAADRSMAAAIAPASPRAPSSRRTARRSRTGRPSSSARSRRDPRRDDANFDKTYAIMLRTARGLVSGRAWNRSAMPLPVRRSPPRAVMAQLICRAAEIENPGYPSRALSCYRPRRSGVCGPAEYSCARCGSLRASR
jgi:hypothetical protein